MPAEVKEFAMPPRKLCEAGEFSGCTASRPVESGAVNLLDRHISQNVCSLGVNLSQVLSEEASCAPRASFVDRDTWALARETLASSE